MDIARIALSRIAGSIDANRLDEGRTGIAAYSTAGLNAAESIADAFGCALLNRKPGGQREVNTGLPPFGLR